MAFSFSPFPRHSLRYKLFVALSLLILFICVTLSSLYAWWEIRTFHKRTTEKARILASSLATAARLPLFADDRETLGRLADETAGYVGVDVVTITSSAGNVTIRAGKPERKYDGESVGWSAPVIPDSPAGVLGGAMGLSVGESTPLGQVRVIMGNEELRSFIRSLVVTTGLTALLFWTLMSYLSYVVVGRVTRSLTPLVIGVRAMRGGDYSARIAPAGNDELTEASDAVNDLAKALQQREAENERLQRELVEAMRMEVREERRKMMAKLIQTNRMTSLGLMVAGMAHEINTPNGAIRLAAQQVANTWRDVVPILDRIAEEEGGFTLGGVEYRQARSEVDKAADIIVRSAERIDRIIRDLRNYNLGERDGGRKEIDVSSVIMGSLGIVRAQGNRDNVRIEQQLGQDLPLVYGNRYQLEQVITNLILNGIQAIPEGRPGVVSVSSLQDPVSGWIAVAIKDDGVGISSDVMQHLMEPFFSTRIHQGGSGLGLYISNAIIAEHGGKLVVTSEPGSGTMVTVLLPVTVKNSPLSPPSLSPSA